jgi:septation ring formation regulator EzrA
MNGHSYIAIAKASIPHLWQWIGGHQKARNNLTDKLLQNLTDSYKLVSVSSEGFRKMIEDVAERPTQLAERNAQSLRDLSGEVADLRGQIINLNKKADAIATMLTRQGQGR